MLSGPGRPRRACSTCKGQKIRCSGERPNCRRCIRLRHLCVYDGPLPSVRRVRQLPRNADKHTSSVPEIPQRGGLAGINEEIRVEINHCSRPEVLFDRQRNELDLNIPTSLVSTLIEMYFENVYQASLLLHKRLFLESIAAGTASPHVLLSVCAWGANFYRDDAGRATLKDSGSMIDWAKRAGRLVFQEAEDLHEENIVTFCNLALFWHSQGSWRVSYLHKGNACQLLHILGLEPGMPHQQNSLHSEIRRRRFWACYIIQCHSPERLLLLESSTDVQNMALPWSDEDFEAGISNGPSFSLNSAGSNGGISGQLIKALTLWSSVVSCIKTPDIRFSDRITDIHSLDEKVSDWWRKSQPDFKLTPSSITRVPHAALPKVLLTNIVYHQCLCALHASIVPLFCWSPGDDTWSSARQLSAQIAFEHACAISALIEAVLVTYPSLSGMPSFVAYAAYCACAIQIPFMRCSNSTVKERARANVKSNVKMIHAMATYWKFSALLQVHVRCLYNIHQQDETVLENEPKYIDISKLTSFKISATHARSSILEFTGVLRSNGGGLARPGEETNDLGIQDPDAGSGLRSGQSTTRHAQESAPNDTNLGQTNDGIEMTSLQSPGFYSTQQISLLSHQSTGTHSYVTVTTSNQEEQLRQKEQPCSTDKPPQDPREYRSTNPTLRQSEIVDVDIPILDVFNPFFGSEMLDLFPNGDMPDFSQFESEPLNLEYLEMDGWDSAATMD